MGSFLPRGRLLQSNRKGFSFSILQTGLLDMPERPRYPAASAVIHLSLRAAGFITNIILIAFLARLTAVYHRTYPAAYVAACWALCGDAPEIGVLLNKSRSIPRLSAGGQLTLDIIGLLLLVPGAFLNWFGANYSFEPRPTSPADREAGVWETRCIWVGCASLVFRLVLAVGVCVDCCRIRRRRKSLK